MIVDKKDIERMKSMVDPFQPVISLDLYYKNSAMYVLPAMIVDMMESCIEQDGEEQSTLNLSKLLTLTSSAVYPRCFKQWISDKIKDAKSESVADKPFNFSYDQSEQVIKATFPSDSDVSPYFKPQCHTQTVPNWSAASTEWPVQGHQPGLMVVLGASGSGKSTFAASLRPDVILRYGEPKETIQIADDTTILCVESGVQLVLLTFGLGLLGKKICIDSFRSFIYGLSGPAVEKGLVGTFFNLLTNFGNLITHAHSSVVVVCNPMVDGDTKAFKTMVQATRGSATSIVVLSSEFPGRVDMVEGRVEGGRKTFIEFMQHTGVRFSPAPGSIIEPEPLDVSLDEVDDVFPDTASDLDDFAVQLGSTTSKQSITAVYEIPKREEL